jgi:LPS export ABC transporter protein LptC/lipopolysaccharide transport protein LptA
MAWQRRARLVVAVGAIAFAVVVVMAYKRRTPPPTTPSVAQLDPKAVVETAGGRTFRVNREHEDVRVEYEHLLTYQDNSTKLLGVKVVTQRAGGRVFTITGNEASVTNKETDFLLLGDVRVTTDDGAVVTTERATYLESEGVVRAPGPVEFSRGRMTGSGLGMTYDKNQQVFVILDRVSLKMSPAADGSGALDLTAPTAQFNRADKTIQFARGLNAVRGRQTVRSDSGLVRLTADEQAVEAMELRGGSQITTVDPMAGSLRSIDGRDIDLKYAAGGELLERARVVGGAVIQLAGDQAQTGRRITASTVDISMAPDGSTPVALNARQNVQVTFPPEQGVGRIVAAESLDSRGDAKRGLTSAHFEGRVDYREQGKNLDRHATSQVLDAALGPGLSTIEEARFSRSVSFQDGTMTASAADARYVLGNGTLVLTGGEGTAVPRMDNDRIGVDGNRIDVTLEGPVVKAAGNVKSTLKPPKKGSEESGPSGTKVPSMLKPDQDVTVTAGLLEYDGAASKATYSGEARLYQGETTIKADTISIDDKNGNLTASGGAQPVATSMTREEKNADNVERVSSAATAKSLQYDDASRRLTYTGDAHVTGSSGDMTAVRIELYLKTSGDELDKVEAYDTVTLREQTGRKTTGNRMTYLSANEQYIITGTPVIVLEPCGRETRGRTLTMYKATDRIVVDGNEQARTQTKAGANCP